MSVCYRSNIEITGLYTSLISDEDIRRYVRMTVTNLGKLVIEYNLNDPLNTLIKPMIEQATKLGYVLELKQSPKEELTGEVWKQLQQTMDVPSGVPRDISPFGMAMLAVCIKYHKDPSNKAYSSDVAKEILNDYPEVAKFYNYETKRISYATIFAADNGKGGGLVPKGLLQMDKDTDGNRRYWT